MREPVRSDADVCWGGRDFVPSCPAQKDWLDRMAARGLFAREIDHMPE